jgi:hypothetical protein
VRCPIAPEGMSGLSSTVFGPHPLRVVKEGRGWYAPAQQAATLRKKVQAKVAAL